MINGSNALAEEQTGYFFKHLNSRVKHGQEKTNFQFSNRQAPDLGVYIHILNKKKSACRQSKSCRDGQHRG